MNKLGNKPQNTIFNPSSYKWIKRFINWSIAQSVSPFWHYGLGIFALGAAILLKLALNMLAGSPQEANTPFLTIFGAIMVTAWFGGFGPGLVVTLLGALASDYFFIYPLYSFAPPHIQEWLNLVVFVLEGILISVLCGLLRQALFDRTKDLEERRQVQEELARERERYIVTLTSIGDAVIATDVKGIITFLNSVAQNLTGWSQDEAIGQELIQVFKIINEQTRQIVESPTERVMQLGTVVGLANHTLLVTKAGNFVPIDDSAAPIKNQAGEIIGVVLVFRDVTERKQQEKEDAFLAQVSEALASTLDYERTLQNVVRLTVPFLADWCSIDLIGEDGMLHRMASAHVVPAKEEIVHQLLERYPYPPGQPHPLRDLLLAGQSQLSPQIRQADLEMMARSPEHLQTLKEIGLKSGMTVPLVAREGTFGAFTLAITESGRQYSELDLTLARELARRAALALDNARLYQQTQQALSERTEAVNFHRQLEEQLTVLVEASDSLLGSPQLDTVLPALLTLSRRLVAADAYGIWRKSPTSGEWRTLAAVGLSEEYQQLTISGLESNATITAPIVAADVEEIPALTNRLEGYRKEHIRSLLVVPLRIQGTESGTLAFYYRQPHQFSQIEIRVATALANLAAAAINSAELYEEQNSLRLQAETAQQRLAFLAEASNVLASSLDYATTLQSVAELAVPKLGDWCTVHLIDQQGIPEQVALAHVDPAKVAWALDLQKTLEQRYPYDPNAPTGLPNVLRTGQAELYPLISDEMLVAAAQDEEQLRLLREIGYSSLMIVPLKTRERVVGALQLVSTESSYHYNERDITLAQELARRSAIAVDNARLYAEAQQAVAIREEFLSVAAHELKTPVTSLRGFAQLLLRQLDKQKELDPVRLHQGLSTINQQSERLLRLIVRLLDLSKLQSGRLVVEAELTDLTLLVERVVEGVRLTTEKHQLKVQAPASVLVQVDAMRIEQVVSNLVDNAVKYSPEGGLIEISLATPTAQVVELRVKDQGLGIAPQFRDSIFQPFYQAHTGGYAGIGMGLYIARQIIELHGGQIEVEFPDEGGTCFVVTLPNNQPLLE